MPIENKRLLVLIEKLMREINRETINPLFPELVLADIDPIIKMVATTRARYLKELFKLSMLSRNGQKVTFEMAKDLHQSRLVYEEMIEASKALDIAIERGYIDIGQQ
ncbi:MAG: hypothetical protein KZQ83_08650 [gamma proteobacterium symbiont of Taylorina sp.]|nr:hypothetical protein [gamma proteobacterium symbiont of Taylorina sp.]